MNNLWTSNEILDKFLCPKSHGRCSPLEDIAKLIGGNPTPPLEVSSDDTLALPNVLEVGKEHVTPMVFGGIMGWLA